jgi:hypothetical protein
LFLELDQLESNGEHGNVAKFEQNIKLGQSATCFQFIPKTEDLHWNGDIMQMNGSQ